MYTYISIIIVYAFNGYFSRVQTSKFLNFIGGIRCVSSSNKVFDNVKPGILSHTVLAYHKIRMVNIKVSNIVSNL